MLKPLLLIWFAVLLLPTTAWGQTSSLRSPAAAHYDLIALRVEFQPDTTRFTTGDGTFGSALFDTLRPKVDPLPHDAAYFEAHLAFLEDYVARVSDGQTTVQTHLIPEVVQVSQEMGAYSPTGLEADSEAERAKLAALVEEAWRLADARSSFDGSVLDPERTVFLLFHAGVGRDIELTGTTLDRTPQDLPSLFFDAAALDRLLEGRAVTFQGLPVGHTLLMPRTETRRGFNFIFDEPFLAEFSINGLLAASFFNYLGVPDLFDTETGESAIGPFGLMDPLGLFAYNGLFPPEPTAWTKYYLGWLDPIELLGSDFARVTLTAAASPNPQAVARAWISGAEYFLVENRYRDPEDDGLVLRVWQDGQVVEQRVANGDETFNSFNVNGFIGGVVVGVDNYDWALPGGVDEEGNELNGGILIWHVDERVLAEGLAENRVNVDPTRRGVDLEEADSGQDLGFPVDNPFAPQNHLGSPFDFYYEGNPIRVETRGGREVRLYENRFGPDTFPNSDANDGGPSFIVLEDFTAPAAEMAFVYRQAAALHGVQPLDTYAGVQLPARFEAGGALLPGVSTAGAPPEILAFAGAGEKGSELFVLNRDEARVTRTVAQVLAKPVQDEAGRIGVYTADRLERSFLFLLRDEGQELVPVPENGRGQVPLGPPVSLRDRILLALENENVLEVQPRVDPMGQVFPFPSEGPVGLAASPFGAYFYVGRIATWVEVGMDMMAARWTYALGDAGRVGQPAFGQDTEAPLGVLPLLDEGALLWLLPDGTVHRVDVAGVARRLGAGTEEGLNAFPVLVDLDADGRLDALVSYGERLLAFTQQGALVADFPIRLPAAMVAQPLVAELTDSGNWSILVAVVDGSIYAYDLGDGGELVDGFPLAVGARLAATPLLVDGNLYAVAEAGTLKGWRLERMGRVWWGQLYGDVQNQSFALLDFSPTPGPSGTDLLVAEETYNWPNPIQQGETYLRCMTTRPSRVRITIVDMAGSLVDEMEIEDVREGVPTEWLWQTDAASGLYIARVTATADDGQTQTRLIKMAVIR